MKKSTNLRFFIFWRPVFASRRHEDFPLFVVCLSKAATTTSKSTIYTHNERPPRPRLILTRPLVLAQSYIASTQRRSAIPIMKCVLGAQSKLISIFVILTKVVPFWQLAVLTIWIFNPTPTVYLNFVFVFPHDCR